MRNRTLLAALVLAGLAFTLAPGFDRRGPSEPPRGLISVETRSEAAPASASATRPGGPGSWKNGREPLDGMVKQKARPDRPKPPRTSEVLLFLAPGVDPNAIGNAHGLVPQQRLVGDGNTWVFRAKSPDAAERARLAAASDPRVTGSFLNRRLQLVKLWLPDDPFYLPNTPVGFSGPGQWHLGNGATTFHANLGPAWNRDLTGAGVILSIVDDGLETTHPDLVANFRAAHSLNFGINPPDGAVTPYALYDGTPFEDRHGTCVAGVAAAVGGNGVGVTGAAPQAGLAIQRIDFLSLTDAMMVGAALYRSSGGDTSIKIKNHSYGAGDTYVDNIPESNAVTTSAGSGTVHTYAAGNSRLSWDEDSNKQAPQNNPNVLAIAALGANGTYSDYSSFGANVFVTAPSSSAGQPRILTTDRTDVYGYNPNVDLPPGGATDTFPDTGYTSRFGGTSSAAPLVAGILALGKQANPAMTVRMAQHALVRTATKVDLGDSSQGGWVTNGASFSFNQNYGFGLIDADKFTDRITRYSGVSSLQTVTTGSVSVATEIPDNNPSGVTRTFSIVSTVPLEGVTVSLSLTHDYRGDLEAYLTSPLGTVCRLMRRSVGDNGVLPDPTWSNLDQWTFLTNAFWGENPVGTWTLNVRDTFSADIGDWNAYTVTLRQGRPTLAGTVLDGLTGPDLATQSSTTSMSARWTGFSDPTIPIASFAYAIGTAPGAQNVLPFTSVGLQTSASTSTDNLTLALSPGGTYYVTVRATDTAGIESLATSDGVQITGGTVDTPIATVLHALPQPSAALLEWDPSPSSSVAFYRVWWKPAGTAWIQATLVDNIVGLTHTVSGLTNGVSYDFLLRAVTATGNESAGSISSATPADGITVNGAGNYGTIQAAINAAAAIGGVVTVQAGTYVENLSLFGGVTLIGASPQHTIISSPTAGADVISVVGTFGLDPTSVISNLGVTGGRIGIVGGSADVLVRNVVVHDMDSHGISSGLSGRLHVINCTLAHNDGSGVFALGSTMIRNSIAASNGSFGFNAAPAALVTFSNAYGNPSGNFTAGLANSTTYSIPVAFTSEAANDFTEQAGAVSIDTGDPVDPFANEPSYNGGRINQGAFGNTSWAGRSPPPQPFLGGGGGGGGCGLTGFEGLFLIAAVGLLRRSQGLSRKRAR